MAKLVMTFDDYISNPMGKNNAVLSGVMRETMKNVYKNKFDNILLRENGKINYYLFKNDKANQFYALIKIPSEVVPNFYYETVIKFFTDSKVKEGGRNLSNYYVQFFSNDPAFVFTYAHTFMDNNLFIPELASKMTKSSIKFAAKEKNPKNEVGYVKSIYFAYLFMKQHGLFARSMYEAAPDYNQKALLDLIEPADIKVRKRQEEGDKVDKRKKIQVDKSTLKKIQSITHDDKVLGRLVTTVPKVKTVAKTKALNSSHIKTVKKINGK